MTVRRAERWTWIATAAVLAGLCAVVGAREALSYDGTWHVFTSRMPLWRPFFDAVRLHAHPPLYFLMLKGAGEALGPHLLSYRLPSIAATVSSIAVLVHLVRRLTSTPWLGPLAGVAFGFAAATAEIALEARGYALAVCLGLAGLVAFRRLIEDRFEVGGDRRAAIRIRFAFALPLAAAFLIHYLAGFLIAACLVSTALLAAVDAEMRRRLVDPPRRAWLIHGLTFALPVVAVAARGSHIAPWQGFSHVPQYLLQPGEQFTAFFRRASGELLALWQPFAWTGLQRRASAILLLVSIAAGAVVLVRAWRRGSLSRPGAACAALLPIVWAVVVLAASLGRYPYGGVLRHQYLFLSLFLIALAVALDQVRSPGMRRVAMALVAIGALGSAVAAWTARLNAAFERAPKSGLCRDVVRDGSAVYVDQFSVVPFFGERLDWKWSYLGPLDDSGRLHLWRAAGPGTTLAVCHDQGRWNSHFDEVGLDPIFRTCLEAARADRIALITARHPRPAASAAALAERLSAPGSALQLVSVSVHEADVCAEVAVVLSRRLP